MLSSTPTMGSAWSSALMPAVVREENDDTPGTSCKSWVMVLGSSNGASEAMTGSSTPRARSALSIRTAPPTS
jgi:hypothetical protein